MSWPYTQGFSFAKYKFSLYLFIPFLFVIFSSALNILTPLRAVAVIMGLGIIKQTFWDVIWHKQKFDWIDLVFMVMGSGIGFLMIAGYYKLLEMG